MKAGCSVDDGNGNGDDPGDRLFSSMVTVGIAASAAAVMIGVSGLTGFGSLFASPFISATPISGRPKPTPNHCRALDFAGAFEADGL